jgi:hypothetical protein
MLYSSQQLSDFPWIASSGTLREEDLLPRFWGVAQQIGATIPDTLLASLQRLVGEDAQETDWDSELAAETCFELIDLLDNLAPVGFYFGASEGDGACFGFWVTEAWADALEHMSLGDCDPAGWAELIAELDADGIEPDSIEDSYQGTAEGWSEERAGADYAQTLADELGRLSAAEWPFSCIDWAAAWRELEMGDGYRLHSIGAGDWLVFRSV